jgi:hypothetical protein
MGILEIVAVLLIIGWALGLGLHVAGAFIHVLLIIAIILIVLRLLRGKV